MHFGGGGEKKAVRGRDLVIVEHDGERFAAPPGGAVGLVAHHDCPGRCTERAVGLDQDRRRLVGGENYAHTCGVGQPVSQLFSGGGAGY